MKAHDKGKISPWLKKTLADIISALDAKDMNLACQLSAVKSFITSNLNPKNTRYFFQEDNKANEKILGERVYSLLDGLHHSLAFSLHEIPSGMMVCSSQGYTEFKPKKINHPIIKRINFERRQIEKRFK
jgi:hypothetical protein